MSDPCSPSWEQEGNALLLFDYQENVLAEVPEALRAVVVENARWLAVAAGEFGVPIVLSTVGVTMGLNRPTVSALTEVLPDVEPIDRSSINAWDDARVLEAVEAAGRRTLVMAGIVTSVCLTYAAMCAIEEGYDVYFVEDAVADINDEFHEIAVARLVGLGAVPISTEDLISSWLSNFESPFAQLTSGSAPRHDDIQSDSWAVPVAVETKACSADPAAR